MKKSLLALLFAVALAVPALAENMWIGGNFGYENTSPKEGDSVSSYYIVPEFGYSIDEKLDIGIDLGYSYKEGESIDIGEVTIVDKTTTIGISPFIRYKMFEIGDFAFLAKASIYYESEKYDEADVTVNTYGLKVVPVVTYSINETWSIGATLDFAEFVFENSKCDDTDDETTYFGLKGNSGSLIGINFSYHF